MEAQRLPEPWRSRMAEALDNFALAAMRADLKRASDRRTDAQRRKLVGARMPREMAQRCKACADALGVSLYRFSMDALEEACRKAERGG